MCLNSTNLVVLSQYSEDSGVCGITKTIYAKICWIFMNQSLIHRETVNLATKLNFPDKRSSLSHTFQWCITGESMSLQ